MDQWLAGRRMRLATAQRFPFVNLYELRRSQPQIDDVFKSYAATQGNAIRQRGEAIGRGKRQYSSVPPQLQQGEMEGRVIGG